MLIPLTMPVRANGIKWWSSYEMLNPQRFEALLARSAGATQAMGQLHFVQREDLDFRAARLNTSNSPARTGTKSWSGTPQPWRIPTFWTVMRCPPWAGVATPQFWWLDQPTGTHSSRSEVSGSTRAARCAGAHAANTVTISSSSGMAMKIVGSTRLNVNNSIAEVTARQA